MAYEEWLLSQFEVKIFTDHRGERVCFKTPLANYTFSKEDWAKVKEKINKV